MKFFKFEGYQIRKDKNNDIVVWDKNDKIIYSTSLNIGHISRLPDKIRDRVLKEKI